MLGLKEYTDFPESIRPPVEVWINCTGDLCLPYEECRNLLNGLGNYGFNVVFTNGIMRLVG